MNTQETHNAVDFFSGMTKIERSCLAYLESCAVDAGGLVEACRMNADDHDAIKKFTAAGLLRFGRVHSSLLREGRQMVSNHLGGYTNWVELTDAGWQMAAAVRRKRAEQRGPFAKKVFAIVNDVAAENES